MRAERASTWTLLRVSRLLRSAGLTKVGGQVGKRLRTDLRPIRLMGSDLRCVFRRGHASPAPRPATFALPGKPREGQTGDPPIGPPALLVLRFGNGHGAGWVTGSAPTSSGPRRWRPRTDRLSPEGCCRPAACLQSQDSTARAELASPLVRILFAGGFGDVGDASPRTLSVPRQGGNPWMGRESPEDRRMPP